MGFQPVRSITTDQARDTGMAMVLLLLLVGYFLNTPHAVLLAMVLLVVCMIRPGLFSLLVRPWLGLSQGLGMASAALILSVLYFAVVTPVGLLRRLVGADPMQLKKWKNEGSVFRVREHTCKAEDMEQPY